MSTQPTSTFSTDRPLTVSEVAEFFGCGPEKVKRQARSGKLPGFKFGKHWYFRRADLDQMIARALHSPPAIGAAPVEE